MVQDEVLCAPPPTLMQLQKIMHEHLKTDTVLRQAVIFFWTNNDKIKHFCQQ
jgi:hypothetical protein